MSQPPELPEGGLQPRCGDDAVRYPARSERCREVRGMLRDHADGDLPPGLREQVEDHVHGCRDCGLALSRAELEVLRLREALQHAGARRARPSEEFTAAVMARARAELRRTQREHRQVEPTEGFTRKVMRGVQRQVERESRRTDSRRMEGRRGWWRPKVLLAAAVLVLSVTLVVVYVPGGRATHVRVVAAVDTWLVGDPASDPASDPATAPGVVPLEAGSELPRGARVRTGPGGHLELTLPASDRGAGSRLQLEADSDLSLGDQNGALALGYGRLGATTGGSVDIHLADGTKVVLEAGASRLEALRYHPFDEDLAQVGDLRVRLVVYAGQAQIWRGGDGIKVLEGRVAYFSSRTPVRQDRAVNEDLLRASVRNATELAARLAAAARQPPAMEEPWLGRLLHPVTLHPVAGATVSLRSHLGPHIFTTDAQGRFRAPDLPQLQEQFVVVTASAQDPDMLLAQGPRVLGLGGVVMGAAPLELVMAQDRRLSGRLLDPTNRPIPGVRLLPVLVDEALGLVEPLPHLATGLEPDGRFAVVGLPATLPPKVSLVLVALCGDRAPQVCFSSQGGDDSLRDAALRLSMAATEPVRLAGLPAGRDLEVLQPVAGLPPNQLFARRVVTTNSLGEVVLAHGGATLWLLRAEQPPQALVANAEGRLRPADDILAPPALAALRAGGEPGPYVTAAGQSQRFARVAEVPTQRPGDAGLITVQQDGAPVQARGVMVFLSQQSAAETVFLGVYAGQPLPFVIPRAGGYRLLALDDDGRLGHLVVPPAAGPQLNLSVPVQAPRSLSLGEELVNRGRSGSGIVHLRWEGEGRRMFLTRQVPLTGTGELHGLVPGSYEIGFSDGTTVRRLVK